MNWFVFAQASTPKSAGTPLLSMLPMFVMIIGIFYFIVYRPQQKEQKKRQALIDSIKKGDKVITAGGIHGIIAGIKDDTVLVKVSGEQKLEISRASITTVK